MDAVKFLKEAQRMCDDYWDLSCEGCPNENNEDECSGGIISIEDAEINIYRVDIWSAEYPAKTRAEVFKELFPNGNKRFCPQFIGGNEYSCLGKLCEDCKVFYWGDIAPKGFGERDSKGEQK